MPKHPRQLRPVLHARVRQLCGDRDVIKCLIHADWAMIEFEKEVVVIVMHGKKFQEISMDNKRALDISSAMAGLWE